VWRLHRYYSRDLASSIGLTFSILFGISILAFLPRILNRTQGESIYVALAAALVFAVDFLPDLVTISALVGTVFTYSRASADNEILAIRASGIHLSCPLAPALMVALLGSVACGWLVSTWIPAVHYMKYQLISGLANQMLGNLASAEGRLELPGLTLTFDATKRGSANTLRNVDVIMTTKEHRYSVWAEELSIEVDAENERAVIFLKNARGFDASDGSYKTVLQENVELPLDLAEILGDTSRKEGSDKDLRTSQIYSELMRGEHPFPEGAWYLLNFRGCKTLVPLVMTLLGFCIGVLFKGSGRMGSFALSFGPLGLYYGLTIAARSLVATTHVTALAWLPVGALALALVPLFWKVFRL
jgi:lipopolysaccharide export system permease protein